MVKLAAAAAAASSLQAIDNDVLLAVLLDTLVDMAQEAADLDVHAVKEVVGIEAHLGELEHQRVVEIELHHGREKVLVDGVAQQGAEAVRWLDRRPDASNQLDGRASKATDALAVRAVLEDAVLPLVGPAQQIETRRSAPRTMVECQATVPEQEVALPIRQPVVVEVSVMIYREACGRSLAWSRSRISCFKGARETRTIDEEVEHERVAHHADLGRILGGNRVGLVDEVVLHGKGRRRRTDAFEPATERHVDCALGQPIQHRARCREELATDGSPNDGWLAIEAEHSINVERCYLVVSL